MRLKTDHITIEMISKTLGYLPFYSVLTPAIRHYIAERVQVESYLPMERIVVEDPLNKLDFLYIAAGSIEFLLDNIINPSHLKQKSMQSAAVSSTRMSLRNNNYYNLRQGGHID